jgi:hypothetical protein
VRILSLCVCVCVCVCVYVPTREGVGEDSVSVGRRAKGGALGGSGRGKISGGVVGGGCVCVCVCVCV